MATAPTYDDTAIERFERTLRGHLIQPEDPAFEEARAIYNGVIDKCPYLIAKCRNVADVNAAVNFGREQGLETAIRSGGHDGPGLALVDDGLVIDLSAMKGIRVDPEARTVRVEPGCTWGDVGHGDSGAETAEIVGYVREQREGMGD